jgi:hypothetical protein
MWISLIAIYSTKKQESWQGGRAAFVPKALNLAGGSLPPRLNRAPFHPAPPRILRGTQLQTSEDVLARNCAFEGLANFKMNLQCRSDEQAGA